MTSELRNKQVYQFKYTANRLQTKTSQKREGKSLHTH